jgi:hypothetical protein
VGVLHVLEHHHLFNSGEQAAETEQHYCVSRYAYLRELQEEFASSLQNTDPCRTALAPACTSLCFLRAVQVAIVSHQHTVAAAAAAPGLWRPSRLQCA